MKAKLIDNIDVEDRIEELRDEAMDLAHEQLELEDERDKGIALIKRFEVQEDNQTYVVSVTIEADGERHYDSDIEDLSDDVIALVDETGE